MCDHFDYAKRLGLQWRTGEQDCRAIVLQVLREDAGIPERYLVPLLGCEAPSGFAPWRRIGPKDRPRVFDVVYSVTTDPETGHPLPHVGVVCDTRRQGRTLFLSMAQEAGAYVAPLTMAGGVRGIYRCVALMS